MMISKRFENIAISIIAVALIQGCAGTTVYKMASAPSTSSQNQLSSSKFYKPADLRYSVTVSGIEMHLKLWNERSTRSYNTSFIVPIETGVYGMVYVGKKPFIIDLALRADEAGAAYGPLSTELFLASKTKPVQPSKVIVSEKPGLLSRPYFRVPCVYYKMPPDSTILSAGTVVLPSKYDEGENDKGIKDRWLCVQLHFDVPTPDPSEQFQLKLGSITTPEGKHIRPIINFSPVMFKTFAQ